MNDGSRMPYLFAAALVVCACAADGENAGPPKGPSRCSVSAAGAAGEGAGGGAALLAAVILGVAARRRERR